MISALAACIPLLPWVSTMLLKSGWIPSLLSMLWDTTGGKTFLLHEFSNVNWQKNYENQDSHNTWKTLKNDRSFPIIEFIILKDMHAVKCPINSYFFSSVL